MTKLNKWDFRMLGLAERISTWSKDIDRKVGCVVTTYDYYILATGFNGYPKSVMDSKLDMKLHKTVHAEINALLRLRTPDKDLQMFIYGGHPCAQCAGAILQSPVKYIVCTPPELTSSWSSSMNEAAHMLSSRVHLKYF
jgi:deoxycytidylate deaminase